MKELISVIVPVYNVEKYLPECIESILNQSYKNIEIILVDDGATDSSGKICDLYAEKDDRIFVIHQKNAGLSVARNVGIAASHADVISFIDSDDFIHPDYLKAAYVAMKQTECLLVCTKELSFMDGQENIIKQKWNGHLSDYQVKVYQSDWMLRQVLHQHMNLTSAQLKVYRRSLFDSISFPDGRLYEDLATTWRFLLASGDIAVLTEPMYAYRIRENSLLHSKYTEKMLDCLWIADILDEGIMETMPDMRLAAATAIFRINRIVFAQMRDASKEQRNKVWSVLCKYRWMVIHDKEARNFERFIAFCSFGGQLFFWCNLQIFKVCKNIKIKLHIRRMQ